MIESLYIAETGMTSQQRLIDVISNNIANASTPGFKKTNLSFVDLVYQTQATPESNQSSLSSSVNNGAGVKIMTGMKDFTIGDLKPTGNPFDLAIQGNGFIEVEMPSGDYAYTRAGRMRLDADGNLVTTQGYKLSTNIQIPPDAKNMTISSDGKVMVELDGTDEIQEVGQLELTKFVNNEGLETLGNNLYAASERAGNAIYSKPGELGTGQILQGSTEVSNVSMTEEMVNLMLAQRGYQLNARIIQVSDQLLDTINNLRR
ncbi:flagellar basal-body rod protein FlgG [Agaribacter marinus]|uniref:Flagellar basal-body rod protein FlgG n=1 Tax=Agaribacter marinus TaxID=1431249 RepID=A0AA37WGC3_9ALTE|nr:flagellar basal-body rod protein FlgG [Agaribacter marinus]GLR70006.1 flagellar basal body rod protein FlgG [Agaribacter marinus]